MRRDVGDTNRQTPCWRWVRTSSVCSCCRVFCASCFIAGTQKREKRSQCLAQSFSILPTHTHCTPRSSPHTHTCTPRSPPHPHTCTPRSSPHTHTAQPTTHPTNNVTSGYTPPFPPPERRGGYVTTDRRWCVFLFFCHSLSVFPLFRFFAESWFNFDLVALSLFPFPGLCFFLGHPSPLGTELCRLLRMSLITLKPFRNFLLVPSPFLCSYHFHQLSAH